MYEYNSKIVSRDKRASLSSNNKMSVEQWSKSNRNSKIIHELSMTNLFTENGKEETLGSTDQATKGELLRPDGAIKESHINLKLKERSVKIENKKASYNFINFPINNFQEYRNPNVLPQVRINSRQATS